MAYFTPAELQAMAQAGVTPPSITPQLLSYCRLLYGLIFTAIAYSIATLLIILQCGISDKLAAFCERVAPRKWLRVPLFCVLLAAIIALIRLPFSWYASYYVDHSYGLSHQSLAGWFGDLVKGKGVDAFLNALVFTLAFAMIDKFPKRWPLLLWACLLPLIAGGIFVAPLVIDPLFNKFTIMPPSAEEQGIRHVAQVAGIPNAPIFVVDKSKQTTKLNAYVTGVGATTRIVIWDNTLKKLPQDQVEAIVAHESGHYVLGHIVTGFLLISGGLLALLLAAKRLAEPLRVRLPGRWNVRSITDLRAIPVVMLLGVVGGFLFSPIENAISREMEHQADAFGLRVTHNGGAMARAFVSLSEQNLSEPQPPAFLQFWLYGHPSLHDRIMFALGR
jgi:Zn-dependent protease with chaperone function